MHSNNKNNRNKSTDFVASLVDNKCDPELGEAIRQRLSALGLETVDPKSYAPEHAFEALEDGIFDAYRHLGLDTGDPSLIDTPSRFAKMFVGELTKGLNYDFFPKCTATPNGYAATKLVPTTEHPLGPDKHKVTSTVGAFDEAVMVKSIRITSLCEHHLQTIDGFAHIAYLPNTKIIGLSKLARVAEFFAARPQVQERMTEQIYHALSYILETEDVGVVIDAVHFCMRARGVRQPESTTQTNKMGGRFMSNDALRKEFLDAIRS